MAGYVGAVIWQNDCRALPYCLSHNAWKADCHWAWFWKEIDWQFFDHRIVRQKRLTWYGQVLESGRIHQVDPGYAGPRKQKNDETQEKVDRQHQGWDGRITEDMAGTHYYVEEGAITSSANHLHYEIAPQNYQCIYDKCFDGKKKYM